MNTNDSIDGISVRPGAASNLPPPPARNRAFGSTLQLLALCPLLAVSDTVIKALGFSVLVLVISPLRRSCSASSDVGWTTRSFFPRACSSPQAS